jgi:hypothetical protein
MYMRDWAWEALGSAKSIAHQIIIAMCETRFKYTLTLALNLTLQLTQTLTLLLTRQGRR